MSRCFGLLLALGACTGGGHTTVIPPAGSGTAVVEAPKPKTPLVTDAASAQANVGKRVEVRGPAEDAKLGPIVSLGRMPVYCMGLGSERWPKDVSGKQVVAFGKLEHTDEFASDQDPNLPSAGTGGAVWVLRSCEYQVQ